MTGVPPRIAVVAIGLLVLALGTAIAQPSQDARNAERLYTEGQAAYDAERYDDAIAAWQESYELSRLPALVFNIAQAHRLQGNCAKAVDAYRRFVELDPESAEVPAATERIAELEPCPDLSSPPPTPVPAPKVVAPVVPRKDVVTRVDQGRGKRIAGAVIGGISLGLVATGAYFGYRADSLAGEVKAACAAGCEWVDLEAKDSEGRTAELLQWAFYGAGAAGLVTSGVLYALGARERAVPVAVTPRGDGAMVTWIGAW